MSSEEESKLIEAWNRISTKDFVPFEQRPGAQLCDMLIATLQEIKAGFGSEMTSHVTPKDAVYGNFDAFQYISRELWSRVDVDHRYEEKEEEP